eukprot:4844716-Alexandrium_andersonii.AAC.1
MHNDSENCQTLIFRRRYQNDSGSRPEVNQGGAFRWPAGWPVRVACPALAIASQLWPSAVAAMGR